MPFPPLHSTARFLLRRFATAGIAVVGVVTLVFVVQRAVPGDPVDALLGEHASTADRDALRQRLGLDLPWWAQYADLWRRIFDGSLGTSFDTGPARTVTAVLSEHIPATLELAVAGVVVALALALPLGLFAAYRAGTRWDVLCTSTALLGVAIPNFWLGPALIALFAVQLRWLPDPVAEGAGVSALVLPAFVLGSALAGKLALMLRTSVLEVLAEPYVLVARARGLSRSRIAFAYVLRNAALPVLTVLGMQFAGLLTGALVTEKVFVRPGLGTLLLDAVSERNYPVVQGAVLTMAVAYVMVNLAVDVLYVWVDPRVNMQREALP